MGHQMARYTPAYASDYRMTAAGTGADARRSARTASQANAPRTLARPVTHRIEIALRAGVQNPAAGPPHGQEER